MEAASFRRFALTPPACCCALSPRRTLKQITIHPSIIVTRRRSSSCRETEASFCQEMLAAGASEVLTKPVGLAQLQGLRRLAFAPAALPQGRSQG